MTNFNKNKAKMFSQSKQRWSLRKLSVGVASVLLGFTFMGIQSQTVSADTTTGTDTAVATSSQAVTTPDQGQVQAQASTQAVNAASQNQQTVNQNVRVPDGYANAMNGWRPNGANSTQAIIDASTKGITENGGDTSQPNGFMGLNYSPATGDIQAISFSPSNYQSDPAAAAETIKVTNGHMDLTADQQTDLTNFAAEVINQIRAKVQAQPNGSKVSAGFVKTSPYATQLGNEIVHEAYDNFAGTGHNTKGLEAAAQSRGINSWVGENLGDMVLSYAINHGYKNPTMDQLKNNVYCILLSMMYYDNQEEKKPTTIGAGGHTTALLNDPAYNQNSIQGGNAIALDSQGNVKGNQYLTVTIEWNKTEGQDQVHFNFISDVLPKKPTSKQIETKNKLAVNAVQPEFKATSDTDSYSPKAATGITTKQNVEPQASEMIANKGSLPSGTTYAWVSQPDVSKAGETTGTVRVTYPDNSYKDVSVNITVTALPDSDKYAPTAQPIMVEQGVAPQAAAGIANQSALPTGTTYTWVSQPDVSKAGEANGTVKVTYPDKSSETVAVKITVTAKTTPSQGSDASSAASEAGSSSSSASSSAESSATSSAESSASSSAESSASSSAESSAASEGSSAATSEGNDNTSGSINAGNDSMNGSTDQNGQAQATNSAAFNNEGANAGAAGANGNGATVTAASQSALAANQQSTAATLPQTGDSDSMPLLALGLLSVSALLGLGLKKKEY